MTVLSLANIHKRFGPTIALDGVSLQLQKGEVHALIGENGAGKSTLMNVVAGSLRATPGLVPTDRDNGHGIGTRFLNRSSQSPSAFSQRC